MKYPQYWGAIADHSGDAYFDFVYRHDWPNTLNELAKYREPKRRAGAYDVARRGAAQGARRRRGRRSRQALPRGDVGQGEAVRKPKDMPIMNVCMAATYDPDPRAPLRFRLPFHLETGELIEARWKRWLAARSDPSRPAARAGAALAPRNLHRLRLARPVPHPLRDADTVAAARRRGHPPHVRGVRRQPLGHRLPDEREPAVPLSGAQALSPTGSARPGGRTCDRKTCGKARTSRIAPAWDRPEAGSRSAAAASSWAAAR